MGLLLDTQPLKSRDAVGNMQQLPQSENNLVKIIWSDRRTEQQVFDEDLTYTNNSNVGDNTSLETLGTFKST